MFAEFQRELTPTCCRIASKCLPGNHPFGHRYVRRGTQMMFNPRVVYESLMQEFEALGGKFESPSSTRRTTSSVFGKDDRPRDRLRCARAHERRNGGAGAQPADACHSGRPTSPTA